MSSKLLYGTGRPGVRGATWFCRWATSGESEVTDLIEVSAFGEESPLQLVGTTLHEMAHVLAGSGAGHGRQWKSAAKRLGLLRAEAAGQRYGLGDIEPDLWGALERLQGPTDGMPSDALVQRAFRPCALGVGTRGGRSRGPASGSRLRLFVCACDPPVRVRVARDNFLATCNTCSQMFNRA